MYIHVPREDCKLEPATGQQSQWSRCAHTHTLCILTHASIHDTVPTCIWNTNRFFLVLSRRRWVQSYEVDWYPLSATIQMYAIYNILGKSQVMFKCSWILTQDTMIIVLNQGPSCFSILSRMIQIALVSYSQTPPSNIGAFCSSYTQLK